MHLSAGAEDVMLAAQALVEEALEALLDDQAERHPEAVAMARNVVLAGGKRLRPVIVLLVHELLGAPDQAPALDLALSFELIHTATLVHDDYNDQAKVRRGTPTIHERHGHERAIIVGDFLFVLGFQLGGRYDRAIVDLVGQACAAIASAELKQLDHVGDLATTPDDYYSIVRGKTAAPFEAGCEAAALLAGADAETAAALGQAGLELGIAFQLVDDLLDLTGDEQMGKPRGTDVVEGKMTLPLIHALTLLHGPPRRRLAHVLNHFHEGLWDELLDLLDRAGSLGYTRLLVDMHLDRARAIIAAQPAGSVRDTLVEIIEALRDRRD